VPAQSTLDLFEFALLHIGHRSDFGCDVSHLLLDLVLQSNFNFLLAKVQLPEAFITSCLGTLSRLMDVLAQGAAHG